MYSAGNQFRRQNTTNIMFDLVSLIYGITIIKKSTDRAGLDHKTFDLLAFQSSINKQSCINKQELFQYLSHLNNQRASLTGLAHERIQMTLDFTSRSNILKFPTINIINHGQSTCSHFLNSSAENLNLNIFEFFHG